MLIDPKLIYLGHVFEGLGTLFSILLVVLIASALVLVVIIVAIMENGDLVSRWIKVTFASCLAISLLCGIGLVVVPDKETYYGMVAASYITEDNLNLVKGQGKQIVDYIFQKMTESEE